MKYCPDCGRKIEDTVKICPYCLCNMEEAGFDKNIPDENTGGNNSRTGRPFSWDDSDNIDLSFLDGVWEKLGGHMEGVEQPTMVFDGYTAHCHSAENGDYDVAVAEIVETDYGYFLRMDSGSGQFGYRWYRDTPNQLDRVDTWETDDLSTYSGTDSYVRVE